MSFEYLEADGSETVYAPLNTTIDADRDYMDLTGLDACACGDQMPPKMLPPGSAPQLGGFYPDQQLTPGMLGALDAAEDGNKMLMLMGGLLGAWMLWAWMTPHREYR